jgi:hypothetical protein
MTPYRNDPPPPAVQLARRSSADDLLAAVGRSTRDAALVALAVGVSAGAGGRAHVLAAVGICAALTFAIAWPVLLWRSEAFERRRRARAVAKAVAWVREVDRATRHG